MALIQLPRHTSISLLLPLLGPHPVKRLSTCLTLNTGIVPLALIGLLMLELNYCLNASLNWSFSLRAFTSPWFQSSSMVCWTMCMVVSVWPLYQNRILQLHSFCVSKMCKSMGLILFSHWHKSEITAMKSAELKPWEIGVSMSSIRP